MLELPLTVMQLLELNKLLKQEQDHRDRARRRYLAQHPGAEPKPRKSLQLLQPAYALTPDLQAVALPAQLADLPISWRVVVLVSEADREHLQRLIQAQAANRNRARLRYIPVGRQGAGLEELLA